MIQFPNCKINLGLNVVSKRSDGFHNIETVFYPVPLRDALEIIPAGGSHVEFHTSGLEIPGTPDQNLCIRAFHLLQSEFGLPGVKMHLHKVIPMGSGLGGGSSDGAFTLKLLNDLFELRLGNEQLKIYARLLGSDCSFFIENQAHFAFEKGDQLEPVAIDLSGLFLAIVIPHIHVATDEAYRMVVPEMPKQSLRELIQSPLELWKDLVINDFEKPVFEKYPVIGEIKAKLYASGAIYAAMSGSGSAVFGIFKELPALVSLNDYFLWITPL
ncbi:MAG: 4-(cytidine 5'-diphospho)-2-C-methyl-D-erythritol kinase [Bacteroidetes bacterium]|nr:4-(cytidine 5'-diphospho)-2-C-methyl-D-erythritol kinase [Bacteroidota bacterium]